MVNFRPLEINVECLGRRSVIYSFESLMNLCVYNTILNMRHLMILSIGRTLDIAMRIKFLQQGNIDLNPFR